MFFVTWFSINESSTPCRRLPIYTGVDAGEEPEEDQGQLGRGRKEDGCYKEQYKVTMVDQGLDDPKVVEGEWHTKSQGSLSSFNI